MTYLDLINRFWRMDLEFNFSHLETHMYFQLLNIGNQSGWRKAVSVPNKRLSVLIHTANKCVIKARQRLHDVGLFYFEPGTTRRPGKYFLDPDNFPAGFPEDVCVGNYLPRETNKVTNQVTNKKINNSDWLPEETTEVTTKVSKVVTNRVTNQVTNRDGNTPDKANLGERKIRLDKNRKDNRSIERENVYKYFRENFEEPERIISRLKNKDALGNNFEDFIFFVIFEKKAGDFIKLAKKPVGYILKMARAEWSYFQQWKGERDKKEVEDAAMSISYE